MVSCLAEGDSGCGLDTDRYEVTMAGRDTGALIKATKILNTILMYVCVCMLFVMMLLGSADILGRYFFNRPILGTFEIFEILLPGIVLLGLGFTQADKAHITVDMLVDRLPRRMRTLTDFCTTIMALVMSMLILWRGTMTALLYFNQNRLISNIHVPMYLPHLFVPLGALALCAVLVVQMLQLLTNLREGN
jgi:TRAP-type transport system small permease protein